MKVAAMPIWGSLYSVKVSFLQIYNEQVHDLLNPGQYEKGGVQGREGLRVR